jgi:hypothetical protein
MLTKNESTVYMRTMKRLNPAFLAVAVALWLPLVLLSSSLFGCQSGTHGLIRPVDDSIYHSITSTVPVAAQVAAQVAPAPIGSAIQATASAVLALLAMWQGFSHARITALEAINTKTPPAPST